MKIYFLILSLIFVLSASGQNNPTPQKGNYFTTTSDTYFQNVIKPWKYQFIQSLNTDSCKSLGQIIFWRSRGIYDEVAKKYWKPNISYDVYSISDLTHVQNLAKKTRMVSSCDSINRGGDILIVGNFILVNTSPCVNCSSSSNIDYCRNIIKRVLDSVTLKENSNWDSILDQLIIDKSKFRS
jgi:hypothetical protein